MQSLPGLPTSTRGERPPYDSLTRSERRSNREDHACPGCGAGLELERPLELVPDERLHDREPGAGALASHAVAVVRDREHDLAVAPLELERDMGSAVLERVLEELGEDES